MTIEKTIYDYLTTEFGSITPKIPVYVTEPEEPGPKYILIQKTGSSRSNKIRRATIAIQSIGTSMEDVIELNEQVIVAMLDSISLTNVSKCELNSDYNFTDPRTRRFRYQAVFDLVYFS